MLFKKKKKKKSSAGTLPSKNKRRLGDNFLTENKNEKGCFLPLTESASSVNKIMYFKKINVNKICISVDKY
jgi:hypothetical protein